MKKSFLLTATLLCFIFIISSCKKDDDTNPEEPTKYLKSTHSDQGDYIIITMFFYDNDWNLTRIEYSTGTSTWSYLVSRNDNVIKFHYSGNNINGTSHYIEEHHYYQDSIRLFSDEEYILTYRLNSNGEIYQRTGSTGHSINYTWENGNVIAFANTGVILHYDLDVLNPYPSLLLPDRWFSDMQWIWGRNFIIGDTYEGQYTQYYNIISTNEEGYPLLIQSSHSTTEFTYY